MEETKWNFNAKRIFLTYPKCEISPADVWKAIQPRVESHLVSKWIVGRETHADGTHHIHAVICLATKLHSRCNRYFDIDGHHPHWKGADNPDGVAEYCRKEGNFIEDWTLELRGYRNAKADREARDRDLERARLLPAIPFELPNEVLYEEERLQEKCRHYWFISKPDWGKTSWVENTFENREVYKRVESNYPFDDYSGETVIIYDDFEPSLSELLNVSNLYKTRTPVFGNTRYGKKYWRLNHNRVIICLSNFEPEYIDKESFKARFNVVYL